MSPTPPGRPVPLSDFSLVELRRLVALGHATPGQAGALFGIDRQAAEALCSTGRLRQGAPAEAPGRPALRLPAPRRPDRRPDRRRPA